MAQQAQYKGLVDVSGKPLMSANSGAYRGARFDRDMMSWSPPLRSADADLLPDMKTLVARAYDLSRNSALASGGIQIHLDNIIGSGLRLSSKPDYRALGQDVEWAAEWSRNVEARFRTWADDPDCFIDAGRRLTFGAMLGLGYRQYLTAGEILSTAEWLPDRGSQYATAIQMVEPARLSNPNGVMDTDRLRGGVELNNMTAPVAYNIRTALESDIRFAGAHTYHWKRVPRQTSWGRTQVMHIFDQERAGQSRGKTGLASVIANSFKLGRLQDISMDAATINSMYAATIETEFNFNDAETILGSDSGDVTPTAIASVQAAFHGDKPVLMDGVKIPHLMAGEKLNFSPSNHPGPNFAEFEKSFLRNLAAGYNMSYEQLARDYSETNYSGARAGLMEAWKFFTSRRVLIGGRFASFIFALWLEEDINNGGTEIPPGAPDFYDAKAAYCRAKWIGPGKGNIDPLKESKADELEMDMGTLTYEDACANRGLDWEENIDQIAREKEYMILKGVTRGDIRGYQTPEVTQSE